LIRGETIKKKKEIEKKNTEKLSPGPYTYTTQKT